MCERERRNRRRGWRSRTEFISHEREVLPAFSRQFGITLINNSQLRGFWFDRFLYEVQDESARNKGRRKERLEF